MDSLFSRRSGSSNPIATSYVQSSFDSSSPTSPLPGTAAAPNLTTTSTPPSSYDIWNNAKTNHQTTTNTTNDYYNSSSSSTPAWKRPLRRNVHLNRYYTSSGSPSRGEPISTAIDIDTSEFDDIFKSATISPEIRESEATAKLIQILLPCIICNRTFSPDALERHSKICTSVNVKDPRRQNRGVFDSSEQRKKDTKAAEFIPPPPLDENGEFIRMGSRRLRDSFRRGAAGRSSSYGKSPSRSPSVVTTTPSLSKADYVASWRRAVSPSAASTATDVSPKNTEVYENSEFGSDGSQDTSLMNQPQTPSYAKNLSPSQDCPYCGRNFGVKAFDRHFKFCQDQYVKKQYETQPVPEDKIHAMERQEVRTKYRPLKNSNSCSSLRSGSPARDFSNLMAMKLYGFMNKSLGRNSSLKKSNESLTNSCYGDYRNRRGISPGPPGLMLPTPPPRPALQRSATTMMGMGIGHRYNTNRIPVLTLNNTNNLLQQNTARTNKSIENVNNFKNVAGSGYGQQQVFPPLNNERAAFQRNSRLTSSLHKNFFRNSKRADPDGTDDSQESTSSPLKDSSPATTSSAKGPKTLIPQYQFHNVPKPNIYSRSPVPPTNSSELHRTKTQDLADTSSLYDPYEKAAKQFEELLKSHQTANSINSSNLARHARKTALDQAFQSVGVTQSDSKKKDASAENDNLYAPNYTSYNSSYNNSRADAKYPLQRAKTSSEINNFNLSSSRDRDTGSYWGNFDSKPETDSGTANRLSGEQPSSFTSSSPPSLPSSILSSDSGNGKSLMTNEITKISESSSTPSDGADLEFEALETMMTGDEQRAQPDVVPNTSTSRLFGRPQQQQDQQPEPPVRSSSLFSTSSGPAASADPSLASTYNLRRKNENSTEDYRRWNRHADDDDFKRNKEDSISSSELSNSINSANTATTPHDNDTVISNNFKNSNEKPTTVSGGGSLAKFCHECGTSYPTSTAKFCPECGERRANS